MIRNNADICFEDTELSSNMEDYLETIEILSNKKKVVRVKDIAKRLCIKMPSVTAALKKLEKQGFINYEKYGYVELTKEGEKLAKRVYSRHTCLKDFFHNILKIDINRADSVACKIEHVMSPETCKQMFKFIEYYKEELKSEETWINRLNEVLERRPLNELHEGDSAVIEAIKDTGQLKKRLREMGFRKGEELKIIKYAPLKDPLELSIKGYNLSLRIKEAKSIIVKPLIRTEKNIDA